MMIAILIGIAFLGVMFLDAVPSVLYQVGRRRELYFLPEIRLLKFERTALMLLIGFYKFLWLLSNVQMQIIVLVFTAVVAASFPMLIYYGVRWFTPQWVRQFEAEFPDFELAQKQAQVQLMMYPQIFPKIVRHVEGWDAWLLTIYKNAIFGKNFTRYGTYNGKYLAWEKWGSWLLVGFVVVLLMMDAGQVFLEFSDVVWLIAFVLPIISAPVFVVLRAKSRDVDVFSLAVIWSLHGFVGVLGIGFSSLGVVCVSVFTLIIWMFANGLALIQLPAAFVFEKRLILFSVGFCLLNVATTLLFIFYLAAQPPQF